ncbi:MAG: TOBE domain-containing protein [Campylobacteraceae bacterium]|jgi:molybdopterin-binding protein|nr:TOBE domain-containing protein [Campylobacteraceae bacterium]
MSKIRASVLDIKSSGNLNIVRFAHQKQTLLMASLGLKDIKPHDQVILNIKSSHIGLAKNFSGITGFENELDVGVTSFDVGELLCVVRVDLDGDILECLLTRGAFDRLSLEKGEMIKAFILASEISIQEVLS